jgi:hypothetical protein
LGVGQVGREGTAHARGGRVGYVSGEAYALCAPPPIRISTRGNPYEIGGTSLIVRCSRITRSGKQCKLRAQGSHGLCWQHSPANADRRRRNASIGGRAKVNREVSTIKAKISEIIEAVEGEELDRNDASVMLAGFRVLKEYIELERRLLETDRLAVEIEELKRELAGEHAQAS